MEEIDIGFRSTSIYSDIPVIWCEDIRLVPNGKMASHQHRPLFHVLTKPNFPDPTKSPFIFAHEFFDALPIHSFQSVAPSPNDQVTPTIATPTGPVTISELPSTSTARTPQWRELVVSHTPPPEINSDVLTTTAASAPLEFQLSLAHASNPSSLVLPETSPRYQALKSTPGAVVEICPEAQSYAAEFARRIGGSLVPSSSSSSSSSPSRPKPAPATEPARTTKTHPSGAALILDYGPLDTIPTSTLRGIRAHKLVSPLSAPGLVDISADVDFTALAHAAIAASPEIEVHGPVEQGTWLRAMGGKERVGQLVEGMGMGEERKRVEGGWERLVERGGGGMGRVYKVLALVPERGGRRPVGFGGGVEE